MTTEWVQTLPGKYSFPASVERHALALHWRHTFKFNAQAMPCTVRFYTAKEGDGCAARADLVRYALDHVMPPLTKCENGLVADIFLTSCRKVLAPRTLGEDEVNTGYARPCDELVVYRAEEWLKVLLHEMFHFFKLDAAFSPETRLPPPFRLTQPVKLFEAFTETWARILNCRVAAHFTGEPLATVLARERLHAVATMEQVLRSGGFRYDDLFGARAAHYKENTNVVAYIVLGALLLQEAGRNGKGLRLDATEADVLRILQRRCRDPYFIVLVRKAERAPFPGNAMRMSVAGLFSEGEHIDHAIAPAPRTRRHAPRRRRLLFPFTRYANHGNRGRQHAKE